MRISANWNIRINILAKISQLLFAERLLLLLGLKTVKICSVWKAINL